MTLLHVSAFVGNCVLVCLFLLSLSAVGELILAKLGWGSTSLPMARLVVGLIVYVLLAFVLGLSGFLFWPPLAIAAVLPGFVTLPRQLRSVCEKLHQCGQRPFPHPPLSTIFLGVAAIVYFSTAIIPIIHYDLLVNYLDISKIYLLQHGVAPIPYNIHSSVSIYLHLVTCYLLSLNQLCNDSVFQFGTGTAYAIFDLTAIGLAGAVAWHLTKSIVQDNLERLSVLSTGMLAWLTMPQTLLLASLDYPDFFTTSLVLILYSHVLNVDEHRWRQALLPGALAGLLIGMKSQLVLGVLVAAGVLLTRVRFRRAFGAFLLAAIVIGALPLLRAKLSYGSWLFPFLPGDGNHAAAARSLLAENAYTPRLAPWIWGGNLKMFFTLQPETGISAAFFTFLLWRVRSNMTLLAMALPPILVITELSGATYHSLRWVQFSLLLMFLASALSYRALARPRRWLRLAVALFLGVSAVASLHFTSSVVGNYGYWVAPERDYMTRYIPSYRIREQLVSLDTRVLYVGEILGYYGSENGTFPSVHDGAFLKKYFSTASAADIRYRLEQSGIGFVVVSRAYEQRFRIHGFLPGLSESDAPYVREFFSQLRVVGRGGGATVYKVGS